MSDSSEPRNLLIVRIMQILEYYSDVDHPLTQAEIIKHLREDYGYGDKTDRRRIKTESICYVKRMRISRGMTKYLMREQWSGTNI